MMCAIPGVARKAQMLKSVMLAAALVLGAWLAPQAQAADKPLAA